MRAPTAPQPRRVVVAALAGAGLFVGCTPALAAPRDDVDEAAAFELLADAASASRTLAYSGTQYVATWGPSATTTALVDVAHDPGRGAQVRPSAEDDGGEPMLVADAAVREELLDVLRDRYVLRLAGEGWCTGRAAHVVEAVRPDSGGEQAGSVAGRFWIDHDTGLLLRREVFDADGRRLRSSAFLELAVTAPSPDLSPVTLRGASDQTTADQPVTPARLRGLRTAGHLVPEQLPEGFTLFEARSRGDDEVLHLAYSDGLSTTSLFSQAGELGAEPPRGFERRTVSGTEVWASTGAPARMVWSGGDRVWTLVSDAPAEAVEAAVAALPHDALPEADGGWRARLDRGAARLAAALNPFS